jgi:mono/diheme cytochrome c family protein
MKMVILLTLLTSASCLPSFDKTALNFDDGSITLTPLVADGEKVTFAILKEKLLQPHCMSCHSRIGDEARLLDWVVPGKVEESDLYQVVKDGRMPKNGDPLDSRYLDLIQRYISDLEPETNPEETPPPQVEIVTLENVKNEIIIPHCIICHNKMEDDSQILSKITPGKPLESVLYQVIENGSMPKGGEQLSIEKLDLLRKYIESLTP